MKKNMSIGQFRRHCKDVTLRLNHQRYLAKLPALPPLRFERSKAYLAYRSPQSEARKLEREQMEMVE